MNAARPLSATPQMCQWRGGVSSSGAATTCGSGSVRGFGASYQRTVNATCIPLRVGAAVVRSRTPARRPARCAERRGERSASGALRPGFSCPSRPLSWRISAQPARRGKEGFNRGLRCPPRFAPALRPLWPGRCSRRGRPRRHGAAVAGSHNRGTGRRPSRLPGRRRMATPDRPSRPAPAPPRWRGEREPRRRAAAAPRSPAARSESRRWPRQSDGQLLHAGSRARAGLTAVGSASAPAWPSPPSPSAP